MNSSQRCLLNSKLNPVHLNRIALWFVVALALTFILSYKADGATIQVRITLGDDAHFTPKLITIHAGDTVQWIWGDANDHSVVSGNGNGLRPDGRFNSGVHRAPFTYSVNFPQSGSFPYYCGVHAHLNQGGSFPLISVTPGTSTPSPLRPQRRWMERLSAV
jgi:plastocyanin